jgi:hypothetical protein
VPFVGVPITKNERREKRIETTYPPERWSETSASAASDETLRVAVRFADGRWTIPRLLPVRILDAQLAKLPGLTKP